VAIQPSDFARCARHCRRFDGIVAHGLGIRDMLDGSAAQDAHFASVRAGRRLFRCADAQKMAGGE
jgi:hypothetical protein